VFNIVLRSLMPQQ